MAPRSEQQSPRPNKGQRHRPADEDETVLWNDKVVITPDEKTPLIVVYCKHSDWDDDKYWSDEEDDGILDDPDAYVPASTLTTVMMILLVLTWLIGGNVIASRVSNSHPWTTTETGTTPGSTIISNVPTIPTPSISPTLAPTVAQD